MKRNFCKETPDCLIFVLESECGNRNKKVRCVVLCNLQITITTACNIHLGVTPTAAATNHIISVPIDV